MYEVRLINGKCFEIGEPPELFGDNIVKFRNGEEEYYVPLSSLLYVREIED